MKRSIPFGNISRPISCPGAVLRALSILAYLDNRLTLQHRCALQCCPLFWVSLPAFWPFFFVICYFFWGDEGNLHLACWPGSRLRGSRPFVPGLSLWPDLQFAVYSMPFFFSLSFASFLFFFFFGFLLIYMYTFFTVAFCSARPAEKSLFDSIFILFELCCGFYGSTLRRDLFVKVGQYRWGGSSCLVSFVGALGGLVVIVKQ